MKYRSDIDGLRGIAVLGVMLAHGGIPGFAGGFAGVDIFFVLSGFLLTSLILDEYASGKFSCADFIARRARRILPALFPVVLVTAFLGLVLLPPKDLFGLGTSQLYTALFSSNLHFWRLSLEYFGEGRLFPLLHTWSLGVEEQFYLLVPLGFIWLRRAGFMTVRSAAKALFVLSLTGFIVWMPNDRAHAFYLPLFRAWEFLIGSLVAAHRMRFSLDASHRTALGVTGLALAVGSLVGRTNGGDAFIPRVLAAVAGTAAAIVAGTGGRSGTESILGAPQIAGLGRISYSLYLWHWPLLQYAGVWLGRPLEGLESAIPLAASFPIAVVSWRFVERPFRESPELSHARAVLWMGGAVTLATVGIGAVLRMDGGHRWRFDQRTLRMLDDQRPPFRLATRRDIEHLSFPRLGDPDAIPDFLIWGDSHAAALEAGLQRLAKDHHRAGFLASFPSCPPLLFDPSPLADSLPGFPCSRANAATAQLVKNKAIKDVILAAHWSGHPMLERRFTQALDATLRTLERNGARTWILEESPGSPFNPGVRAVRKPPGADDADWFSFRRRQHEEVSAPMREALDASQVAGWRRLDPAALFCDVSRCRIAAGGRLLYRDGHHLTLTGAELVSSLFGPVFAGDEFVR